MTVSEAGRGKLKLGALSDSEAAHWLADHRGQGLAIEDIVKGVAERLVSDGVPLMRLAVNLSDYHPEVIGRAYEWEAGEELVITDRAYTPKRSEVYLNSPIRIIADGASAIRRRLDVPSPLLDFPIVAELKQRGATDYVGMALEFSDSSRHFVSWTTRQPGGFTADEMKFLDLILPLLCVRLELAHSRRITEQLLTTYLGADAMKRIMSGAIRRSMGDEISAIIFYCDLRGFTRMTDSLPAADVIRVLGEYFDAVGGAVRMHGGDIIKMIGDGMLAIFPVSSTFTVERAANEAVEAAREARATLASIPPERLPEGVSHLQAGFVLHVGQVTFGNIGSRDRLDFTVIGPAVNEAVRVEPMTKSLGHSILMTAAFAALPAGLKTKVLGFHVLRGVREPREIFALAD